MEAPASITCPDCRARWLRYHDEAGRAIHHSPVSYVKVYLSETAQLIIARSYADLRAIVQPLPGGTTFRVQLVAFMAIVGEAMYTRLADGVVVLLEEGAAGGLHLALMKNIPVETS